MIMSKYLKGLMFSAALTGIALPEKRDNPASKLQTMNLIVHITGMENIKHNSSKSSSFLSTIN